MISGKKSEVYLRKYLFVEDDLEIIACDQNPQRYPLIVEEVFYRFKHEILVLSINDSKKLCALYYLLTNMEKIGKITASNFQIQKLKILVPETKWQLLDNSLVFEKDIYSTVKVYQQKM